jgi:Flp pilus assembly protein TadG
MYIPSVAKKPARHVDEQPTTRVPRLGFGRQRRRRGASTVEFALVAPVLFTLVFGMIEMGRAIMVAELAVNGAREGARKAALTSMTASEVTSWTQQYLQGSGIPSKAATVTIKAQQTSGGAFNTTSNLAAVPQGLGVQVTVDVKFADVTWLPKGFLRAIMPADAVLSETSTMRKETY